MIDKTREIALIILYKIDKENAYSNIALDEELRKNRKNLNERDIGLRMGIYQIVFLDKIPKSAAVNESVNLAKRYGHSASANFVNAILRKIEKKDYEEIFETKDPIQRIMLTTSTPKWLVEELLKEYTL